MDFDFDTVCVDYRIRGRVNYQLEFLASQGDHLVRNPVWEEDSLDRHKERRDREEDKNRQDSAEVVEGADNFCLYRIVNETKN